MTQAHNANQLLDITLRELSTDPSHFRSMADSFIDQWVRALGSQDLLLTDIAVELEQLKASFESGKNLKIAESLHSLAKLTKTSVETADEEIKEKLKQLATTLESVAQALGRKNNGHMLG